MLNSNISTELIYLFVFLIITCIIYSIYSDISTVTKKKPKNESVVELVPELNFINDSLKNQYFNYLKYFGEPNYIERNNSNNSITSVLYMNDLILKSELGKFKGLDYIKLNSYLNYTHHPKVIFNNITVGKYIRIPERLYGSILYSSPTFSIDQLNVPREFNDHYKILPSMYNWSVPQKIRVGKKVKENFEYASNTNTKWMEVSELRNWIKKNQSFFESFYN